MRNQFGYCIRGSHPLLEVPKLSNHGIVRIYWASGKIISLNDIHVLDRDSIKNKLDSLFDIEGPGKQTTLKCGSCKCGKCAIGQSQHSLREERELNIIKSGMTHDEESQQWIVNYPWIKNPNNLPNNVNSAVSRLGSTEKRLLRNSLKYASAYDEQIMDMVKRGIARKLTKEEMEIHSGPIHYIPHHEVLKPESKSTPLRIVFNSSSSYMGHTLNDYWAKGSNVINDLLAVLIRFRQESIALAGDISKNVQCDKTFTVRSAHTPICVEKFRNTQRSRSLCIVDSYFWRQTEWSYFDACITSNSKNVSTHIPRCIKHGDKKQLCR
ncbi:Hypothetical predicted protein [Mytilus galloprovincialis]|uniref:Uncharacterized protein n=1 Tax=Mytilus galloprovincialis TaxID=29158 RepID=A0A8B6C4H3_MYTGA|nr:Hypothetical predicted protein [Mytilus galloprovincialis]